MQDPRRRFGPPPSRDESAEASALRAFVASGSVFHSGFDSPKAQADERDGATTYLPIEALRAQSDEWFRGERVERTFLSSGTTQASRSRSHFSPSGLGLYESASLAAFYDVLGRVFKTAEPWKVRGFSLVPRVADWPDSSLAQMVEWIARVSPVTYVDGETLTDEVARAGDEPVWIFGTAFHLVNAIDDGKTPLLPPGSIVIETGGTKGRSRSVTREDLYRDITQAFGIPERAIVSEYGMCELASQAYDWTECDRDLSERRFRFPSWAKPLVFVGPGETRATGEGLLAVDDPLRVDYPWPLRTEDLARIDEDGSFELLGRAPAAPLKGCSLRVEEIAIEGGARVSPTALASGEGLIFDELAARSAATRIGELWRHFIASQALNHALTSELGSAAAALVAISDLQRSAPQTVEKWLTAARTALGDKDSTPKRWLFVLPQNHSLAGFHPLLVASIAGLHVTVRIPERFATKDNALTLLIDALQISTVPASYRLGRDDDASSFDAVLAYGSDETIDDLRTRTSLPLRGYGSQLGLTILPLDASQDELRAAAADALGLGQSGCLSTRLFVVLSDESPTTTALRQFAEKLAAEAREYWSAALPITARAALELEQSRYAALGFDRRFPLDDSTPLVVYKCVDTDARTLGEELSQYVASRPFTLSIVALREGNAASFVKTARFHDLVNSRAVSVTAPARFLLVLRSETPVSLVRSDYGLLSFRTLGEANAPAWNGTHESCALFTPIKK